MPHNEKLSPKKKAFRLLFGQIPLTKFKDYRKSIKVELTYAPQRKEILNSVYDFVKATWSEDGRESERASESEKIKAFQTMLEGKAMSLGIETIDFIFRISGITRIDTHQIVRQRVGVTFSQQCTGDRFLHHTDCLVEESIAQDERLLEQFIDSTLRSKISYSEMCDSQKVSIQAARSILPHNLETFIFMKVNLMTLLQFYSKRIDDGSQTWQMNEISRQMAEEVCKVYPELKEAFEKMKSKFKFQTEAGEDRENNFSTSLYLPKNDEFEFHNKDFLYNQTKEHIHFTDTPIEDRYYFGPIEIKLQDYEKIKSEYEKIDKMVFGSPSLSISQIIKLTQQTNGYLHRTA